MSNSDDLENTDVVLSYLQQPLIWTSEGNLPVADLRQVPQWNVSENMIQFVLEYYYGEKLVRRDVHNYGGF